MKTEKVTVTYNGNLLLNVEPQVVFVDPGDVIQFERGEAPGVPRRGKFLLTFTEKEFFHIDDAQKFDGKLHEDGGLVHVGALPHKTTYRCELVENGAVIAS